MAIVELAGQLRDEQGKGAARRLRSQGLLPGIVYSPGEKSRMVALPVRSFEAMMRRAAEGTVLIDLKLQGKRDETLQVLIKEVQREPATSRLLHVDFMHISMDKLVRVNVPIRLAGIAEGVKSEGGFVDHMLRDVEVECLPGQMPEFIEVDITPLAVGQSIHVGEIAAEGFEVITPADQVIVVIHGKPVGADLPEAEAEAAVAEGEEGQEQEQEQEREKEKEDEASATEKKAKEKGKVKGKGK